MASAPQPQLPSTYFPGPSPTPDPLVVARFSSEGLRALRALLLAVIVLLVVLLVLLVMRLSKRRPSDETRDLSRRLARRGWTLYLMKGCGYCTKQMEELGKYPRHVVLSADPSHRVLGGDAGLVSLDVRQIPAFPFWCREAGQTRDTRTGYQDMAALKAMAA